MSDTERRSTLPAPVPPRRNEEGRAILLLSSDAALYGLIDEWLGCAGYTVVDAAAASGVGLVIADIPSPRLGGNEMLLACAKRCPGVPILALSSAFFSGIERSGEVARSLGVAGVLPKPLGQAALLSAVGSLLGHHA